MVDTESTVFKKFNNIISLAKKQEAEQESAAKDTTIKEEVSSSSSLEDEIGEETKTNQATASESKLSMTLFSIGSP